MSFFIVYHSANLFFFSHIHYNKLVSSIPSIKYSIDPCQDDCVGKSTGSLGIVAKKEG